VVEADGRPLPIDVTATSRPCLKDVVRLRSSGKEYGDAVRAGLLHNGDTSSRSRGAFWPCPSGCCDRSRHRVTNRKLIEVALRLEAINKASAPGTVDPRRGP
jgi:hypothetical protein